MLLQQGHNLSQTKLQQLVNKKMTEQLSIASTVGNINSRKTLTQAQQNPKLSVQQS